MAYEADVDGELHTDAGCDDEDDSRDCTELNTNETHHTEQLQDNQTKHQYLQTSDTHVYITATKNDLTGEN